MPHMRGQPVFGGKQVHSNVPARPLSIYLCIHHLSRYEQQVQGPLGLLWGRWSHDPGGLIDSRVSCTPDFFETRRLTSGMEGAARLWRTATVSRRRRLT